MDIRLFSARRRRSLGAIACGLAALLVTSCVAEPYTGSDANPKVAVVGDSLILHAHDAYRWILTSDGWDSSVTGLGGFSVGDSQAIVTQMAATHPAAMEIALGTNDVRYMAAGTEDMAQFRALVAAMLTSVADVACVVWVGVAEYNGAYPPLTMAGTGPAINAIIKDELAKTEHANRFYADWAALSTGHPELFNAPGDPHIDETPNGNLTYTTLGVNALAQCPGAPNFVPPTTSVTSTSTSTTSTSTSTTTTSIKAPTTTSSSAPETTTTTPPNRPLITPRRSNSG
jgi:hypothetical protein